MKNTNEYKTLFDKFSVYSDEELQEVIESEDYTEVARQAAKDVFTGDREIYQEYLKRKEIQYEKETERDNLRIEKWEAFKKETKDIRMKKLCGEVDEDGNVICPRCGSKQIQVVRRQWSFIFGFATNQTMRVCVRCNKQF